MRKHEVTKNAQSKTEYKSPCDPCDPLYFDKVVMDEVYIGHNIYYQRGENHYQKMTSINNWMGVK